MGNQPVVIVDGMILAYRINAKMSWMSTKAGVPTGLRFGVMRSLLSYQKEFNARQVVVAWDLPGPILKAKGITEYKADRIPTDGDRKMFDQLPELRTLISYTKWDQLILPGYEADDLIAAYAALSARPIVIVTNDQDLQQILEPGVVIHTKNKNDRVITHLDVKQEWGVNPNQLALLRSGLGDASDNLEPLVQKEHRERFRQFLKDHPEVTGTKTFWTAANIPGAPVMGFMLGSMMERELLMRPNYPVTLQTDALIKGTPDRAALEREFNAMESKTLQGSLHKMV